MIFNRYTLKYSATLSPFIFTKMGVPGFFRWLVNRYPLIRRRMSDPSRPKFNHLYIDCNGILYRAVEIAKPKTNHISEQFVAEFLRYLDTLVQICRPTDTLFIAVDGCAPSAKNVQQRSRRFKAAQEMHEGSFDRCNFTPGTAFMDEINDRLMEFIKEKKQIDEAWRTPKVIYSSSFVPGEGEHKILDYIRSCRSQPDWKVNTSHILYSTDADLIFLGLRTHEPYFTILREADSSDYQRPHEKFESSTPKSKWSTEDFELLHLSLVREYLSHDFSAQGEELEKTIDDYVALSFLIGNDFIPEFFDVVIQKGSFNVILDLFKEMRQTRTDHLVNNNTFNKDYLKALLTKIVSYFEQDYQKSKQPMTFEEKNRQFIVERYPQHKNDLDAFIKSISFGILDAFHWVLQYYNSGCPSWTWSYRYHYSPPLQLIIPYIDEYEPHFELGTPTRPFLQLLYVLPPQSLALLPKPIQTIMKPSSPVADLYPLSFDLDLNGRKYDYQAIVLIPLIDFDRVRAEYEKLEKDISPEDMKRNKVMKTLLFEDPLNPTEIEIHASQLESVNKSTMRPPCVPTFYTLDKNYTTTLKVVPVLQFQFPSKLESMLIEVNNQNRKIELAQAKQLLDQLIIYGWPYLKQGIVVAISSGKTLIKSQTYPLPFLYSPSKVQETLLSRYAVKIDNVDIILHIKPLVASNIAETKFLPGHQIESVPYQLTFDIKTEGKSTDPFNNVDTTIERFAVPPSQPPTLNSLVLFERAPHDGSVGKIIEVKENSCYKVEIQKTSKEPNFAKIVKDDSNQWITSVELAKILKLPVKIVKKLLSDVYVKPAKLNIAFVLFSKKSKTVIDGMARLSPDGNQFSIQKSLVSLIQEYISRTGNLIKVLTTIVNQPKDKKDDKKDAFKGKPKKLDEKAEPLPLPKAESKPNRIDITVEAIFGQSRQTQEKKLRELTEWLLRNSPASTIPMVPASKGTLSGDSIRQIENVLTHYHPQPLNKVVDNVKEDSIIWATKTTPNTASIMPKVGDRVVSIACSGSVPFGAYGVVLSVDPEKRLIGVIFDQELECGSTFEGLLLTNRGVSVMADDLRMV